MAKTTETPIKTKKKEKTPKSEKKTKKVEINLKRKYEESGDLPKRTSGYLIFCAEKRSTFKDLGPKEIMIALGDAWKKLDKEKQGVSDCQKKKKLKNFKGI